MMAFQSWLAGRDADREARDRIGVALEQGGVPLNLLFAELVARLAALEPVAAESPANAFRLEPGYRRYDMQGAALSGGPAIPAIASAARAASESGYPAVTLPFESGGQWYAAIVKERRAPAGGHAGYEGIQFPVSRILDWWSRNGLPPGSSAALLTHDGRIWLRSPFSASLVGARATDDPFAGAAAKGSRHLTGLVDYDDGGIDAIVGWRSLESFGLVFAVGVDRSQLSVSQGISAGFPLAIALAVTGGAFLIVTFFGQAAAYAGPAPAAPQPSEPPRPESRPPPPNRSGPPPAGGALTTIVDKMPAILFEQRVGPDLSVSYSYVSHGMSEILGLDPDRVLASPGALFDMVHADDREEVRSAHETAWTNGSDIDLHYRVVKRDGQERWIHNLARASAWAGPGGNSVWDGILLDITDQKQAEKALRAARNEAEITSKVKAEFLANVSHELRTPLNAIIGFADVIGNETFGPVGIEKYLEYAHDIRDSADHLLALVNDILDLSKIEAGRASLVMEDVDASDLADSCLRLIHGRAADARLQLRRRIEESLPRLRVDPLKMKQILINLLSNAIKFTRSGGSVTLSAYSTAEGGIAFAVTDTGIGIAEKDLSKVVESYGQVEPADGIRPEGTGLGLPLAKALTELHGGEMRIESATGRGTTVTVLLPPECIAPGKRVHS